MKKKPESFTWALTIILLLLVVSSIISIVCSECFSPNQASIIGGVLGAFATGLLGVIAFWQNKRYKELSDELNDRAYMPEFYKTDVLGEELLNMGHSAFNNFSFNADQHDNEQFEKIFCDRFKILNPPALNITVKSIKCAGKQLPLKGKPHSLYEDEAAFLLFLGVPQDFIKCGKEFMITFIYENMYGTKYEKTAFFTLNEGSTTATKWKMNRARRIN